MIKSFKDVSVEEVFNDHHTRRARRICPDGIWRVARRKLDQIDSIDDLRSLNIPPANRLEALKDDRNGYHSIRINDQYRVVFRWTPTGAEDVEIVDYH